MARLRAGGFSLLDTQFVTEHLQTFGAIDITRARYHALLEAALDGEGDWGALALDRPVAGSRVLEILQTRDQVR